MKNFKQFIPLIIGGILIFGALTADSYIKNQNNQNIGATILYVTSGGTGSTTLTGILKGSGINAVATAINGTDYTLTTAQSCTNQVITALTAAGGSTCSSVSNAMLSNSTISGVALGANLAALTNDTTLNGSSYNGSGAISDWGLNLGNANTWTALQTFGNASTTQISSTGSAYFATTSGNVGIGTTTPTSLLQVSGATPKFYLSNTSGAVDGKHWFLSNSGGDFSIGTTSDSLASNTTFLTVKGSTGKVGIGTTGSRSGGTGATLDVWNNLYLGQTAVANPSINSDDSLYFNIDANNDNTTHNFIVAHNGTGTAGAELFRIQENGNVGIGTSTPSDMLDVAYSGIYGGMRLENMGTGGGKYNFYTTNNSHPLGGGKLGIYDQNAGLYRMLIDGNGNVGIGTTSPWKKFSVDGTVSLKNLSTDSTVGLTGAICLDANNELKLMSGAGTCVTSSEDYKKNILPLTGGLDWVMQMKPVSFDYKSNNQASLGFTAEDMDKISPLLTAHKVIQTIVPITTTHKETRQKPCDDKIVTEDITPDTLMCPYEATFETTENQTINTPTNIPYTVRYELLPAVLVKAIQEQQIQINALKPLGSINSDGEFEATINKQIADLQAQVKDLQKQISEISLWSLILKIFE